MRRLTALVFATVLLASGCTRESRFLERSVSANGRPVRYRVWLPPHYTKLHHWPVILYLHDGDERGDDNIRQLSAGLAPALQQFGDQYRCIVVFPQCPNEREWYGDSEEEALAALEAAVREFHGDRRRISLTGVGMGGTGAWYLARHRRRFAAVLPAGGDVARKPDDPFPTDPPPDVARIVGARDPYATLAAEIGRTPVWTFDNDADARAMTAALHATAGNARLTEVAPVAAARAYSDPAVIRWLLAQRMR